MTKLIGITAAFLTSTGFLPQIIRGFKTKKLEDVSTVMLLVIAAGNLGWIIYGFLINDWIIICANTFTFSTIILLLAMKYFYGAR